MHKTLYITTSIPYANAIPHIGFALELLWADVLARQYRSEDFDVRFSTGTDEHGLKMHQKAEEQGIPPQQFADEMSKKFHDLCLMLNVQETDFIRTTDERHRTAAQVLWRKIAASDVIYMGNFEGLYCVGCEEFKMPKDLVNDFCPLHNTAPILVREQNYFFRLSAFQDRIVHWYQQHPESIFPQSRFREMQEFVSQGLRDVPISRPSSKLPWGVPVPDDPKHVMYVWFEALINYLSVIGFGTSEEWLRWWPADVHIIGKDINRFHSVLWPAMLMAADLALPKKIAVHGFISVEGQKMSKTIGNVIAPETLIARYSLDGMRYVLLREIPFTGDGDFSYARFDALYTAELSNGIGNCFSRVTNMIEKYCDGIIVMPLWKDRQELATIRSLFTSYQFDRAIQMIAEWVKIIDVMLEEKKPWSLAKNHPDSVKEVLADACAWLYIIATTLKPVMPKTAEYMLQHLSAERIVKASPLFPRLPDY